jgi:hypothetical protein
MTWEAAFIGLSWANIGSSRNILSVCQSVSVSVCHWYLNKQQQFENKRKLATKLVCRASYWCSGGTWFESQPVRRPSWLRFCCVGESWDCASSRKVVNPSRLPHFLDNRLTDGGEVVILALFHPLLRKRFLVLISVTDWVISRVIARRIRWIEKSIDLIGNRTRDLSGL